MSVVFAERSNSILIKNKKEGCQHIFIGGKNVGKKCGKDVFMNSSRCGLHYHSKKCLGCKRTFL